jgi:hypothetical protein
VRPTILALLLGATCTLTVFACGGGGSAGGKGVGGLAFTARWPQLSAGAAGGAAAAVAVEDTCGGITSQSDIPADVDAVRIVFESAGGSGDGSGACCVLLRRGTPAFVSRYLKSINLRVGSAILNVAGFGPGPVPNGGAGELCPTDPADGGQLCDASGNPPRYDSGPVSIEVRAGEVTDSGAICVWAVVPPTATPAAEPTATPPLPPTRTPATVTYTVGAARGPHGASVTLGVTLVAAGFQVYGTDNEIGFASGVRVLASASSAPDCKVNPALNKQGTFFAFRPPGCAPATSCNAVRAFVTARPGDSVTPVADGTELYSCRFTIAGDAPVGNVPLRCGNAEASAAPPGDPSRLVSAECTDGEVVVEP